MNKTNLKNILSNNWNLKITSLTYAPRQFVAKTYYIETNKSAFFCKVIEKKGCIQNAVRSLPVLTHLYRLGIDHITVPTPTANGNLCWTDNEVLVILFNYIEGTNGQCDASLLGSMIAKIHQLSPQLNVKIHTEQFTFKHTNTFLTDLKTLCSHPTDDPISQNLRQLMKTYHEFIVRAFEHFVEGTVNYCV